MRGGKSWRGNKTLFGIRYLAFGIREDWRGAADYHLLWEKAVFLGGARPFGPNYEEQKLDNLVVSSIVCKRVEN